MFFALDREERDNEGGTLHLGKGRRVGCDFRVVGKKKGGRKEASNHIVISRVERKGRLSLRRENGREKGGEKEGADGPLNF